MWPTPSATPYGTNQGGAAGRAGPVRPGLDGLARTWPTPSARDWRSGLASEETHARNSQPLNEVACRTILPDPTIETDGSVFLPSDQNSPPRSQLNPAFVEWLMGWPEGWTLPYVRTDSAPVETEFTPSRPPTHGGGSGLISFPAPAAAVGETLR